jgi:hypothetical protein
VVVLCVLKLSSAIQNAQLAYGQKFPLADISTGSTVRSICATS